MVKLNNKKIKWAVRKIISKEKTSKEISEIYNVSQRWIQILVKKYKPTGEYPKMNRKRRPKTELTDEQKAIIDEAYSEAFFGARLLRHHIFNFHNKRIPQNKMHKYMLEKGYSKPNKRKQKQRKRCGYERDHSLSLLHADWTEYGDKLVIAYQDDASRKILSLMEFSKSSAKLSIKAFEKAREELGELAQFIKAINTDRGTEFYPNNTNEKGERNHIYLDHLKYQNIKHIPSRVNNPQTNGKLERWFQECSIIGFMEP